MPLKILDILFAGFMALLGSYVVWQSVQYDYLRAGVPGPGFFPLWIGLLIVGFSVFNLYRAIAASEFVGDEGQCKLISRKELTEAALLLALTVAFGLLAPFIGMAFAAVPFMVGCGLVLHRNIRDGRYLIRILLLSGVTAAASAYAFGVLLGVPLL